MVKSWSELGRPWEVVGLWWSFNGESLEKSRICSAEVLTPQTSVKGEIAIDLGLTLDVWQT